MSNEDTPKYMTKEEFLNGAKPREDDLVLKSLGNKTVRVRGLSIGGMATIRSASSPLDSKGIARYDPKQDRLLSIVYALVEPKLSIEDTAALLEVADGVADEIIGKTMELSLQSQDAYETLKQMMKSNPYLRRLYTVCVEKLGRFPIELDGVPEEEFVRYLAAAEAEAEVIEEEIKKKSENGG